MISSSFLPKLDESFHGFIYRVSLVNDLPERRKMFNNIGQWNKVVKLTDLSRYFAQYGDLLLLELLERSGFVRKETRPFRDPVSYTFQLYSFFYGIDKSNYNEHLRVSCEPIRFCHHCIQESIRKVGFGYFKAQWFTSMACDIHKTSLHTLDRANRKTVDIACQEILRGKIPESSIVGGRFESWMLKDFKETAPKTNEIFISQCMRESFRLWLSSHKHDFPEDVLSSLPFKGANALNKGAVNQLDFYHEILFLALMDSSYRPFHSFWAKYAKKALVNFGVITKTALTTEIYISTESDCQRCNKSEWRSCPANLVIEIQGNERPLFVDCINSLFASKSSQIV